MNSINPILLSAHLSEKKTLVEDGIAENYASQLEINNKLAQRVTDETLLALTIRGYPYIDVIETLESGKNKKVIDSHYKKGLPNELIIEEEIKDISVLGNNGRKISQKISTADNDAGILYSTADHIFSQDIDIYSHWNPETSSEKTAIETTFYSPENKDLGFEKTTVSNQKIIIEQLDEHLKTVLRFRKDENCEDFFSLFEKILTENYKEPTDIYLKSIIKSRKVDASIQEWLGYLEPGSLYPFESGPEFTRIYTVLEFGYRDKYVKAFYFSPSNETGNKPVYMIIKEDITIEDETENVEKDFFIDSDKERLIDTIMPLIKK